MISRNIENDMRENVENWSIEIDDIIIFVDQEFLWKNIVGKIFFDMKEEY